MTILLWSSHALSRPPSLDLGPGCSFCLNNSFLGSPKSYPQRQYPLFPYPLMMPSLGVPPVSTHTTVHVSIVSHATLASNGKHCLRPQLCWEWEPHHLSPSVVFWYLRWQPQDAQSTLLNGMEPTVRFKVGRNGSVVNSCHGSRSRREAQGQLEHPHRQKPRQDKTELLCFNREDSWTGRPFSKKTGKNGQREGRH